MSRMADIVFNQLSESYKDGLDFDFGGRGDGPSLFSRFFFGLWRPEELQDSYTEGGGREGGRVSRRRESKGEGAAVEAGGRPMS